MLITRRFSCIVGANFVMPFIGGPGTGFAEMHSWGTSSDNILPFGSTVLFNAWIVNLPQILLSVCYLALNSICTSIASAEEWNNLSTTRKGLRVTRPLGKQRSTYFLQLPYKWALPLMITSGTLHWLLSQSFFLVRLDVVNRNNIVVDANSKSACGLSRLSLMVFFIVFLVLVLSIGWAGVRHMKQRLPFAASCSLVISAACHPAKDESNPHLGELKWGAVNEQFEGGYGHCSITSKHTKKRGLVEGRMYR